MRTVVAGVVSLLVAVRLRTQEVVVDGQVCGRVHDLGRGSWEPVRDERACLDAAVAPLWGADAALLVGVVLLATAAVLVLRRVRPGRRYGARVAATWATAGAAVTTWVSLRLDPGPTCPAVAVGGYDEHQRLVREATAQGYVVGRCLAEGGGVGIDAVLFLAATGAVAAGAMGSAVLLVLRRRSRQRVDQGGWPACATS